MQVKKDLNNTQRKLLDEVYSKQFKARRQDILAVREKEIEKIQEKALKDFAKDKEVKKFLEAGKQFYELRQKLNKKLEDNGVGVTDYINKVPELKMSYSYSNNYTELPVVQEYKNETRRISSVLDDRETEMRTKIWGLNISYEEIEAEIKALLANL